MSESDHAALIARRKNLSNRDDAVKRASNSLARFQALGRLPKDVMNNTEKAFAAYLAQRQSLGAIVWWKFHPMNVRLAKNTYYEVDFLAMESTGNLVIYETKGTYTTDKGQIKIKLCAEALPVFKMVKVIKLKGVAGFKLYF